MANPNAAEFLCETFYVCELLFWKELLSDISNIFQAVFMNETQKFSLSIHREKTKLNATHAIPKNLDTGDVNVALQEQQFSVMDLNDDDFRSGKLL